MRNLAIALLLVGVPGCSARPDDGKSKVPVGCEDRALGGSETDIDCGGDCDPCSVGEVCKLPGDCQSGVCGDQRCRDASCSDGVENGDETAVDCGGACPACPEIIDVGPSSSYAIAGDNYVGYVTTVAGHDRKLEFGVVDPPPGLTIETVELFGSPMGKISWVPGPNDTGTRQLTITVRDGSATTTRDLQILVEQPTVLATANVTSARGGTVAVSAPGTPLDGARLEIPAGVVSRDTPISMGEVTNLPPLPTGFELAGPAFHLAPSGLLFSDFPHPAPLPTDGEHLQQIIDLAISADHPVLLTVPGLAAPGTGQSLYLFRQERNALGMLQWTFVRNQRLTHDAQSDRYTISADLEHLSLYAVVAGVRLPKELLVSCQDSLQKIDALRRAWEITKKETADDFSSYLANALDPDAAPNTQLWPAGNQSCATHAAALKSALDADPTFAANYNSTVVNSGAIMAGGSTLIPHYVVEISPADGVGPSFLADRYTAATMHLVESSFSSDLSQPSAMENLVNGLLERIYKTDGLDSPESVLDAWEAALTTPVELTKGILGKIECEDASGARQPLGNVKVTVDMSPYGFCPGHGPVPSTTTNQAGSYLLGPPAHPICFPCGGALTQEITVPIRGDLNGESQTWDSGVLDASGQSYGAETANGAYLWTGTLEGSVSGVVIERDTSAPVSGASVVLDQFPNLTATSGADGSFEIMGVPACGQPQVTARVHYQNGAERYLSGASEAKAVSPNRTINLGRIEVWAQPYITHVGYSVVSCTMNDVTFYTSKLLVSGHNFLHPDGLHPVFTVAVGDTAAGDASTSASPCGQDMPVTFTDTYLEAYMVTAEMEGMHAGARVVFGQVTATGVRYYVGSEAAASICVLVMDRAPSCS